MGAGLSSTGDGLIALGTTLACGVLTARMDTSGEPSGMTICTHDRNRWLRLLPAMAGMSALDWFLPMIGVSYKDLDALIAAGRPGAGGALTIPIFSEAGERAPFVDAAARGRIVGLSPGVGRSDLARSVCEGIGFAARHCLETGGLDAQGTVTLTGGGSRAPAFRQLLADVLGRTVLIGRQPEAGARGAAMGALAAAGYDIDEERWTEPEGQVLPNPELRALYDEGYRRYREEIASARGHWSGPVFPTDS
jgi:sugar (pentulose or hexulose) kinase